MNTPLKIKHGRYVFGSTMCLSPPQRQKLIKLFHTQPITNISALGGRGPISMEQVENIGPVVVKHYMRGGMMGRFNKQTYVRWGKTRCRIEFELLNYVRSLGVRAPEPVAYAHSGGWFYHAWLITKKIENQGTLSQLSTEKVSSASLVMSDLIDQVLLLINHNIFHVDLHPGNVIVTGGNRAYLLDFDKGRIFRGSKYQLQKKYLSRWQRAVSKHRLPELLLERMETGLMKKQ